MNKEKIANTILLLSSLQPILVVIIIGAVDPMPLSHELAFKASIGIACAVPYLRLMAAPTHMPSKVLLGIFGVLIFISWFIEAGGCG